MHRIARLGAWLSLFVVGFASAETLYLVSGISLVRVDTAAPSIIQSSVTVTGLQPAEQLLAIDVRPSTGQLYALGNTSRLYVISTSTGVATQVGSGAFTPALSGTAFGFDFNPIVDRIRVVSDTGQNLRLNPDTGAVAAIDTTLNGGATAAISAAYSNNVTGAASTTLYVIGAATDALYIQGSPGGTPLSPNGGTLTLVGSLGVNTSTMSGFDISPTGVGYASLQPPASVPLLYTINLATGSALLLGQFPAGLAPVTGIAIGATPLCTLDIDGNGSIDALTDGLMMMRAMFGLTGTTVTNGAVGTGASRTTWAQLRPYLNVNCGTNFGP